VFRQLDSGIEQTNQAVLHDALHSQRAAPNKVRL
jgi:hypothetical protein